MLKILPLFIVINLSLISCYERLNPILNYTAPDSKTDNNSNDNSSNDKDVKDNISSSEDNNSDDLTFIPPADCTYRHISTPTTHILAGTNKGIYYSDDNGLSWKQSTSTIGSNDSWVSFADLNDDIVLVGSGNNTDGGNGILKSTDGGKSWKQTSIKSGSWSSMLYVGGNIVLAGGDTAGYGGVWQSGSKGDRWVKNSKDNFNKDYYQNGVNTYGIDTGVIDSFSTLDRCTVIVGTNIPSTGNLYNSIHLSKDGGKSWYSSTDQPHATKISTFLLHTNGIISASGNYGIFASNHPEASWDITTNTDSRYNFGAMAQLKNGTIIAGIKSVQIDEIGVDEPKGGLWRSTDNGSFGYYDYNPTTMDKYLWLSLLALDNDNILAGCTSLADMPALQCSGLFISTDNGNSWSKLNNELSGLYIYKMISIRR